MSQKAITIYTPPETAAHIAAEDDAFIHRVITGADSGILGNLQCVKVDNNTVRLSGGGVSNYGYILWIPDSETLELAIDNGTIGYNRIDIVTAVFTRGGNSTADTHVLKVIKGTATTGTATAPTLSASNLLNSGDINQIAIFNVYISGTEITKITQIAENIPKRVPRITYGTGDPPAGGQDGDIYIKIV